MPTNSHRCVALRCLRGRPHLPEARPKRREVGRAGLFALALFLAAGCAKDAAPPQPIAVDQAAGKLEEAMKKESVQDPEVRKLLGEAVDVMNRKDYGRALFLLQTLSARSDLTPEQRDLATRSLLSVNKALDEQASGGDVRAREILQLRRATK